MTEPKGKYVKKGDVEEWVWNEGHDPGGPKLTGGWVVPDSEFDPTSVETGDLKSASEKVAEASESKGLTLADEAEEPEPKKVTTKTAEPLTKKK